MVRAGNPGGHSFSAANVSVEGEAVTVPVNALDDYLATQGVTRRLDLLKMDVHGFEAKVRGARPAVTERKTGTYISSPAI